VSGDPQAGTLRFDISAAGRVWEMDLWTGTPQATQKVYDDWTAQLRPWSR
jgi:hypothetical protein